MILLILLTELPWWHTNKTCGISPGGLSPIRTVGQCVCISQSSCAFINSHDVYSARMAETYLATANCVWPAAVDTLPLHGQDLIPLQRLHVFAHSRDPHPAIKLWCQVPFTKCKTILQIEMYCMQCFLKSKYIKVELSMIKIGELLRKLWSLRSCFLILPPGAFTPQGIKGAVKRDVSKHWCTLQWCASRGWVIAHENWTSCIRWTEWFVYDGSCTMN